MIIDAQGKLAMSNPSRKKQTRDWKPLVLLIAIIVITILHYQTVGRSGLWHEISQRLYYLPIIYAAYSYGFRGGVTASVASAAMYLPHIVQHWANQHSTINQFAETILFLVIGIVTGLLAEREQRERAQKEQTNLELKQAYEELRSTMDQLLLADRHASLGQMSAAIVHEIRNPLGAIKGAAEALETKVPQERAEFIEIIKREVERLNRLVTDFLQFARPRSSEMLLLPPREVVDSVVKLIQKQAAQAQVSITVHEANYLPTVMMDAEQMKQVLLNLILNALDAMPQGGTLQINLAEQEGQFVLAVQDSGKGIDATVRDKLFSPFVTTKTRGTGLGLAIAHRLVGQHGGHIHVSAGVEGGAKFEIRLPLNASQVETMISTQFKAKVPGGDGHGG